ncbi:hypothetical protein CEXT_194451 [Caerostris extrusa]|uniref:Uncharacterized protein n=1 Tax=Caerostris extrusa TaxID=172846 RepID=A0AAV4MQ91_CAEEX|nr:hypothetical protein CEXT_194451 [Caerostris extrusa]
MGKKLMYLAGDKERERDITVVDDGKKPDFFIPVEDYVQEITVFRKVSSATFMIQPGPFIPIQNQTRNGRSNPARPVKCPDPHPPIARHLQVAIIFTLCGLMYLWRLLAVTKKRFPMLKRRSARYKNNHIFYVE